MKMSRLAESQITQAMTKNNAGKNLLDICRELKIYNNTFYYWFFQFLALKKDGWERFTNKRYKGFHKVHKEEGNSGGVKLW